MKTHLITFLLLLISNFSFSQNGGQFFENNVIRINYLGYSNEQHTFIVCNKQDCEARIRTKADQDSAIDIIVRALECETVYVARPTNINILFRAKAETACITRPDMGWLEINTSLVVLSLNETNVIKPIRSSSTYKVSFVGGILKSDFGNLSDNQITIIYDGVGRILFKHRCWVKKQYEINLNDFLVRGMNFISVYIENKTYDYHLKFLSF